MLKIIHVKIPFKKTIGIISFQKYIIIYSLMIGKLALQWRVIIIFPSSIIHFMGPLLQNQFVLLFYNVLHNLV